MIRPLVSCLALSAVFVACASRNQVATGAVKYGAGSAIERHMTRDLRALFRSIKQREKRRVTSRILILLKNPSLLFPIFPRPARPQADQP